MNYLLSNVLYSNDKNSPISIEFDQLSTNLNMSHYYGHQKKITNSISKASKTKATFIF